MSGPVFTRWGTIALVVAAVLSLAGSSAAELLSLPDLAERTKPSVVHLTVKNSAGDKTSTGTGFVVSSDGRVVTNEHVISSGATVTATLADGRKLDATGWLTKDREKDIAIIQLVGEGIPKPLPLGGSEALRQGDEIVVIGSPRGLSGTLSTGIVSAIRGEGLDGGTEQERSLRTWAIQITAPISPGSSGSPIMTRDGSVVAVAVGIMRGEGSLNFGVPIEQVRKMLTSLPPGAEPTPFGGAASVVAPGSPILSNLIISAVFFGLLGAGFVVVSFVAKRRKREPKRR